MVNGMSNKQRAQRANNFGSNARVTLPCIICAKPMSVRVEHAHMADHIACQPCGEFATANIDGAYVTKPT